MNKAAHPTDSQEIYIGESAHICRVDPRTFNTFVGKVIEPAYTDPHGRRVFHRKEVQQLRDRLPRRRKKGFRLLTSLGL